MARILVVDDDPQILKMIEDFLSPRYQVVTASDGVVALQRAIEARPDVIIADIVMPNMDGPAFINELWAKLSDRTIPVIFLTGLMSKAEEKEQNQLIGSQNFLAKPFSPHELEKVIIRLLQS